jgi:hypothetical protein
MSTNPLEGATYGSTIGFAHILIIVINFSGIFHGGIPR